VLETDRLLLRRFTTADLDELVAVHADPEVTRVMGLFDRARALRWMEANELDWAEQGYGRLAIVDRVTGAILGRCGLKYWSGFDETEVGWVLRRDAWGHGFATEAGRASVDWGFRSFELPYITAMIRPDNPRSLAVAERLGMSPRRDDVLLGQTVVVYAVDRE
jgi:RimJ/RimL family protein N-acetyltransferase